MQTAVWRNGLLCLVIRGSLTNRRLAVASFKQAPQWRSKREVLMSHRMLKLTTIAGNVLGGSFYLAVKPDHREDALKRNRIHTLAHAIELQGEFSASSADGYALLNYPLPSSGRISLRSTDPLPASDPHQPRAGLGPEVWQPLLATPRFCATLYQLS